MDCTGESKKNTGLKIVKLKTRFILPMYKCLRDSVRIQTDYIKYLQNIMKLEGTAAAAEAFRRGDAGRGSACVCFLLVRERWRLGYDRALHPLPPE